MSNLSTWRKLLVLGTAVVLLSCQKENSRGGTGSAAGRLGIAAGVCTPVITAGDYRPGVLLTSANTVTVEVTVTSPGAYTISTNFVNGVSFSKTGIFTTTGVQSVILNGSGIPANSGNQNFTVTFGSSTCNFFCTFTTGTVPATGTAGGSPGSCTPVIAAGTYTQGVTLTVANTIQVQVNVATVGTYTISTNTVNGVSFSNSGTFTTTGLQNVILTGTGTPTNSGSQNFAVTFDSSTCNFSINFGTGTTGTDYFPTTINSYWTYRYVWNGSQGGFMFKVIPYALTTGGNIYSTFTSDNIPASGYPDSSYYRKTGGDYFEYINNTEASFEFDGPGTPTNVEFIFLKDNVPQGTTWNSPTITGIHSGVSLTIYIKMTLLEKGVTATSGIVTSTAVMKVRYEFFETATPGTPYLIEERWFAKGIGKIYDSFSNPPGFYDEITSYQVF